MVAILLGFLLSPDFQLGSSALHTYLACVLLYYGIVNNGRARLGYWVSIAAFIALVLFFLSLWVFEGGVEKILVFNRWAYELASSLPWSLTTTPSINVLGGAFAVVIPGLTAIALFQQKIWLKWSAGILATIFLGILLLSASGGGWIATIAATFIVLFWWSTKVFWRTSLVLGTAIGATLPIWYNANWVGVVFPLQNLFDRIDRWQATVTALQDNPLGGLGIGGWWSEVAEVSGFGMAGGPHNAYLQLYSDTGILGIMACVIGLIIGGKLAWQVLRANRDSNYYGITVGIVAGLIAGGIYALIDDNLNVLFPFKNEYLYFTVPLLWLWAALLVVSHKRLMVNHTDVVE
jgi:O-antigen ligase